VSDANPDHAAPTAAVDLDRVQRDLEGVEAALARLDAGTYWTDEITGAPLGDDLLAADPVARRVVEQGGA
jgi:RNA polymerase-binding transcription factor DksA